RRDAETAKGSEEEFKPRTLPNPPKETMRNVLPQICIVRLACIVHSACTSGQDVRTTEPAIPAVESGAADAELTKQIAALCNDDDNVSGEIGVTVIHVESGRTVEFEGEKKLPLYSV